MNRKTSNFTLAEATMWSAMALFLLLFFTLMPAAGHMLRVLPDCGQLTSIVIIGIGSSLIMLVYFLFSMVLALRYRPELPLADDELPSCTVIVPAYNEGRHVAETLETLLASDYPEDKLEIIAINDGSQDDTWHWIENTAAEHPGRITAVNLLRNGGKKNALYIGMKRSRAEIVVTVDSDSCVPPNALRNLAAPFRHPDVGAVAGNVRVKNLDGGWIPRMLDTCFIFGFEFIRCAQSVIGAVFCTPGALSAYRRSAIDPCLDEWLEQTFLGKPSHIGEDRAITTLLLRDGHQVLFQTTALAETRVPEDYSKLCRMLIRWNRSDIRENLAMCRFVYKDFPLRSLRAFGVQFNLSIQLISTLLPVFFLPLAVFSLAMCGRELPEALAAVVVVTMFWACIPAMIYIKRRSVWSSIWVFAYALFAFAGLSWIAVYSLFTVRNSAWLTRELKSHDIRRKHSDGFEKITAR